MRVWAGLGLMVAGLMVLPRSAVSKPRDVAVMDAKTKPGADLNEILRQNGWTVLGLPSDMYQVGKLFRPGSSSSEGTCVNATPITGELPRSNPAVHILKEILQS